MTYLVINPDGTTRAEDGAPDRDTLIRLTGDGVPELIRTIADPVLWVNDDYIALHARNPRPTAGERNIIGTVVAVGMGAPTVPYCGPMVITGLDTTGAGWTAAPLDGWDRVAVETLIADITAIVGHGEVPEGVPEDVVEAIAHTAELARTTPVRNITTVRVTTMDEFLSSLGVIDVPGSNRTGF